MEREEEVRYEGASALLLKQRNPGKGASFSHDGSAGERKRESVTTFVILPTLPNLAAENNFAASLPPIRQLYQNEPSNILMGNIFF